MAGGSVIYSETLIDHFRSPRNVGMMREADAVGESEDPSCGDLARFHLKVTEGRVVAIRFQTYGCGPSIAASSLLTELVEGQTLEVAAGLEPDMLETALGGLPADRRHAATVAVEALRVALARYRDGRGRPGHA